MTNIEMDAARAVVAIRKELSDLNDEMRNIRVLLEKIAGAVKSGFEDQNRMGIQAAYFQVVAQLFSDISKATAMTESEAMDKAVRQCVQLGSRTAGIFDGKD